MPNALLSVPHFEQSRDGMCLPACVRMVLGYWRRNFSELEMARYLGAKDFGTPITNVERLRKMGYQVDFGSLTPDKLTTYLLASQPVIARVWTDMLGYGENPTPHVVVVVGFDATHVYLNDPALSTPQHPVIWNGFLAAWAEFDETAAVIYSKA